MYQLVFGKGISNHVVLAVGSLLNCIDARQLSGDLILNPRGEVLQGMDWLFPWEKAQPSCYVRRMQKRWTH